MMDHKPHLCQSNQQLKLSDFRLLDLSVVYSICWTTDLDFFLHMNNSKYIRKSPYNDFDMVN